MEMPVSPQSRDVHHALIQGDWATCFLLSFLFPYRLGVMRLRMRGSQPSRLAIPEHWFFGLQHMEQVAVVIRIQVGQTEQLRQAG